jgi:tRNA pseudouridine38/39 synthase
MMASSSAAGAMDGVGNQQQQQEHQEQQQNEQHRRQAHLASLASRLRALADEAAAAAAAAGGGAATSTPTTTTTISAQLRALVAQEEEEEKQPPTTADAVRRRLERLVQGAAAADGGDAAQTASKRPRRQQQPKPKGKKSKGAARQYDARKYGARRVLLEIAYMGQRYRGFARQTPSEAKRAAAAAALGEGGAASDPAAADTHDGTVEGALFSALRRVCLVPPGADPVRALGYSRCGRTDRGVSALGQVVALTLRSSGPPPPPASTSTATPAEDDGDPPAPSNALFDAATVPLPLTPTHLLPSPDQEIDYAAMLNRALPPDVRVLGWADPPATLLAAEGDDQADAPAATPPPEFDARFSASYREYLYFFASPHLPGPGAFDVFSPSGSNTTAAAAAPATAAAAAAAAASAGATLVAAVGVPGSLDVAAMDAAARHLEGEHDFRSFCKLDTSGHVKHFVRRVLSARIVSAGAAYASAFAFANGGGDGAGAGGACVPPLDPLAAYPNSQTFALRIRGTAFLYHQVRCIAAVLLMVGRGLERPEVVRTLLDVKAHPRKPQYALAPEQPLLLYACGYGGVEDEDEEEEGRDEGKDCRGAAASAARPGLACGRIRWHRSARALQAAEASLGALLQSHLVGAAMAGAMLERVRRDAARSGGNAKQQQPQQPQPHDPLLERATEPSLDERFRAMGIPTDGLSLLDQRRKEGGGE